MRNKHPRQKSEAHLAFIRGLPCCMCGDNTSTEAAHIRMAYPALGKRTTGKGEKPDDKWTIPLCGRCHREQHDLGERLFWGTIALMACAKALALWSVSGDHELGEVIVSQRP